MSTDKEVERDRYEARAQAALSENLDLQALSDLPPAIRTPYLYYQACIKECITSHKKKVLEIGAGTGMFTEMILATGAQVLATDISKSSLEILTKRFKNYSNIETKVADMESLPFVEESFDVVLCAGSLSYGDNRVVMNEIYRILKVGGKFICVDSLNHNPVYRFNRWIQYLRNIRTRSTIERMPTLLLVESYGKKFGAVKVHFFGSIIWASPLFRLFIGMKKFEMLSNRFDNYV
ncbi:MAG: class I SAM-dependent methyltransferase, partial [bacterium]